jgi:SAM-dependent methyltransferase
MEGRSAPGTDACPDEVLEALPDGWRPGGAAMLDLDAAHDAAEAPPLPLADASCRLVWSLAAFTAMDEGWAEWLLEARRLLADNGILVVGLGDPAFFERLTGETWDESRIGMTILSRMNGTRASAVFHSDWWLRAHWSRAFELVEISQRDGRRLALLGKPAGRISAEELQRPAEGDDRELVAALANGAYLRSQLDRLGRRHRHELEQQREEMGRELMRRSFAAADLDWARRGPGSPATLVAAEYEATTSWRLTRPLRALGAMVRRLK